MERLVGAAIGGIAGDAGQGLRSGCSPGLRRQDSSGAAKMINARSETAGTKAAFRDALKSRTDLIRADAFYEWERTGNAKQPYGFEVNEGELFAFAGIFVSLTKARVVPKWCQHLSAGKQQRLGGID